MTDRSIINVRERPLSSDIMLLQSLQQRATADMFRYLMGSQFSGEPAMTDPNVTFPHSLAMGLQPWGISGQSSITVQPGCLMLNSTSVPVALTGADSSYRVGFNRSIATVSFPTAAGASRMCLLVATIQEVIAVSETRDIMNASTAHFEPSIVAKLREWRVAFSWVQGAANALTIPAVPAGMVPICSAFVSPSNQILSNFVIDLRPTPEVRPPGKKRQNWMQRARSVVKTSSTPYVSASAVSVSVSEAWSSQPTIIEQGGGLKMYWGSATGSPVLIDMPVSGGIVEPGTVLQAASWFYLYLAPWDDYAPGGAASTSDAAGVLVCSSNAPNDSGFNASTLNLPTPFQIYPCPSGRAPCVGILYRNAANTGWAPLYGVDGTYNLSSDLTSSNRIAYDNVAAANTKSIVIPTQRLPLNAKWLKISVEMVYASATSENIFCIIQARQASSIVGIAPNRAITPLPATDANGNSFDVKLELPFDPSLPLQIDCYADLSGVGGQAGFTTMAVHILEVRT